MTHQEICRLLEYRPSDGAVIWKVNRSKARAGGVFGKDNGYGYLQGMLFGKKYYAHRVVWFLNHGRWPISEIDHINGVRTDNRIENLREVSRSENSMNQRHVRSDSTTGIKGVSKQKGRDRWRATITVRGERFAIGNFDTPDEAAEAYLSAKKTLHHTYVGATK